MLLRKLTRQQHDYNIKLTREELLCIAHDSISDYYYTNKMLDLIKKEADRLGNAQGEQGQEVSGDRS